MNIAIVTGASSGMGREFVRQLNGYVSVDEIWAVARRASALETLKAEATVPVRPIVLDLLEESSFTELEALLESEKPNVRLLVNAAGFGKFGAYQKVPVEDDCRMIDLNCKALLLMTRLCVPYMQPGSHILELDSLSAFQPVPYITTYAATKAFVLSYSRETGIPVQRSTILAISSSVTLSRRILLSFADWARRSSSSSCFLASGRRPYFSSAAFSRS